MANFTEGSRGLPAAEELKVVKSLDYRITAERMRQWLGIISAETGVECSYYPNTLKGQVMSLEITVNGNASPDDVNRVRQAIERHQDEFRQLSEESQAEAAEARKKENE